MTDLTERQVSFIDNFVELNDAAAAYEKAGYAADPSNANKLVSRLSTEINAQLQTKMALSTGLALSTLEAVMRDEATAPRDKINAANSWLDRTGVARSSTVGVKDETPQQRWKPVRRIIDGRDTIVMNDDPLFLLPKKRTDETDVADIHDSREGDWDLGDRETYLYLQSKGFFN
mgnify:CR=1 FL=1|jgi:phage terminase small subunit